jgi:hypothetical protein
MEMEAVSRAARGSKAPVAPHVFTIETMDRSLPAVSKFVKAHKGFHSADT